MASRNGKKQARNSSVGRRLLVGLSAGGGAFLAAAAMATGSAITAAPAHADFEDLLDPIIQPFLTSLTDSIAVFDPTAALDLTSWSDSVLASLNTSFDFALPAADSAAALSAAAEPAATTLAGGTIPLSVLEGTEPAVNASIDGGGSVPLLVDTGSSGLVVPYTDLDPSNSFQALLDLFQHSPANFGLSGYSGGVEYVYATYNNLPVDYLNDNGTTALATNGPVDVELFSWSTNSSDPFENFQSFLSNNDVQGILGIGENTAGPTTTPFENYGGVLVDVPDHQLVVESANPLTSSIALNGAPNVDGLTETVKSSSGALIGTGTVSNDLDSGGVYGNIPSSIATTAFAPGDTITVSSGSTELYSYTVQPVDSIGDTSAPTIISGNSIDSGVEPFLHHAVYLDYATDKMYIGPLTS